MPKGQQEKSNKDKIRDRQVIWIIDAEMEVQGISGKTEWYYF